MLKRFAISSLISPLKELSDRVSLEVPAEFIRGETTYESADQQSAAYSLTYYTHADNKPHGRTLDVTAIVKRLIDDVMEKYDVEWDVDESGADRNTHDITVTIYWAAGAGPTEASASASRRFADTEPQPYPLTLYLNDDVYNIGFDEDDYALYRNGEKIDEALPSPSFAFGRLASLIAEQMRDVDDSAEHDFLGGLGDSMVDDNTISEEAKDHFVKFYEMTTLHQLESEDGEE